LEERFTMPEVPLLMLEVSTKLPSTTDKLTQIIMTSIKLLQVREELAIRKDTDRTLEAPTTTIFQAREFLWRLQKLLTTCKKTNSL
jgi:hypothetical protein